MTHVATGYGRQSMDLKGERAWMRSETRQSAVTLLELLLGLGIVAILLAILIPSVQGSREAARRAACQMKLRSWALATQAYVSVLTTYPPAATWRVGEAPHGRPEPARHGFFAFLLPFCDQVPLADRIDLTRDWNDPVNDMWTHQNLDAIFLCPSAPGDRQQKQASDYTMAVRVDTSAQTGLGELLRAGHLRDRSGRGQPDWGNGLVCWEGLLPLDEVDYVRRQSRRYRRRPESVTDGLSRTALLFENAGKPWCYRFGRRADCVVTRFRWASPTLWMTLNDWCGEQQLVNCHNNSQPYGFHPGGLNWVFADGSTRFCSTGIDPDVFVSAITATAGD